MARDVVKPSNGDAPVPEVSPEDKETRLVLRGQIDEFEHNFRSGLEEIYGDDGGEVEQINDDGLREYTLDNGVYIRELFIPKDMVICTKLWNRDRFWIIAYGHALIKTELGTEEIIGPHRRIAPYGSKAVLRTYEDTLWFAITKTEHPEDLEATHEDVFANDYSECVYPWDRLSGREEE